MLELTLKGQALRCRGPTTTDAVPLSHHPREGTQRSIIISHSLPSYLSVGTPLEPQGTEMPLFNAIPKQIHIHQPRRGTTRATEPDRVPIKPAPQRGNKDRRTATIFTTRAHAPERASRQHRTNGPDGTLQSPRGYHQREKNPTKTTRSTHQRTLDKLPSRGSMADNDVTSLHLTSIHEILIMTSDFELDNGSTTRTNTHSADEDHHETRPIASTRV